MAAGSVERAFQTMGSDVDLVCWGTDADAAWAESDVGRLERRWSQAEPCGDVARINRAAGHDVAVTPETVHLVAKACTWWHLTDGLYDPTRSAADAAGGAVAPGCDGIWWHRHALTVHIPADVQLDLTAIATGAAVDHIVDGLRARGARSAIRVTGEIEVDASSVEGARVTIRRCPATEGLHGVTVRDRSAARGAVLATAVISAGPARGEALLRRFGFTIDQNAWFLTSRVLATTTP
jgi:thiamine biosynthesis lipoprotein ApbE